MARVSLLIRAAGPLLLLVAAGCGESGNAAPYLWPQPFYGDRPPQQFVVRYSDWRNDPEQLRQLIADTCGGSVATARVFERPYRGTLLHPQELAVTCGDPPPPTPAFRDQPVDPGYLMRLRDPAPAQKSP